MAALGLFWTAGVCPIFAAGLKILPNHVLSVTSKLQAVGDLPATNELWLAIGLPLRDPAGLTQFLKDVSDPASPQFRHYLTPEEFTAQFGPTEQDYAAVEAFAATNGFTVTGTHGNRLLLDVRAKVADIQRAFHLHLRKFQHPHEAREFFAPDVEPTVDSALPMADVSGLNNFQLPHPKLVKKNPVSARIAARSGSAPTGDFLGDDFRAAYMPDTALTGAGQSVGVFEFDGYYASDISAYAKLAGGGRTNIAIQPVLVNSVSGKPGFSGIPSANEEVSLDIEMAMAMAPGLATIKVFEGKSQNSILSQMAANSTVKNLSCCWGWGGGPSTTTDAIFKQMVAQGQSFFNASGDSDAFTTGVSSVNGVDNPNPSSAGAPSSSPYITQVGGTTLVTTGPGGAWQSESVWNWGNSIGTSYDGSGSSGGISSYYSIPAWQTNVSMASNQGSTTKRNIPDVALNADNVYIISGGSGAGSGGIGGTSCSAPLWAGLSALANQQAVASGKPSVGFINPVVYAIGTGAAYAQDFHDTTTGDNTWSSSPSQFYAVTGYDLCTGWGTPTGQNLIDALVAKGNSATSQLGIVSDPQLTATGVVGGPFSPSTSVIILTNTGTSPLTWTLLNPSAVTWLKIAPTSGALAPQATTNLSVSFTAAAANLAAGNYSASFKFTNQAAAAVQIVTFQLQVLPVLSVQPTAGFNAVGPVGGPFVPAAQDFTIVNLGGTSAVWKVVESSAWLAVNQTTGVVAAVSQADFTVSLTAKANALKAGIYKSTVTVRNRKNQIVQSLPFILSIGQTIVTNGGFETGDFTGWTLNTDAGSNWVTNRGGFVHSGRHGAALGQTNSLGYLSQTLPTIAGQTYQLSLWLDNPKNSIGATPNEFQIQWEGATIYDGVNLPFTTWTNLQFTVTAANSGSLLQLGFQDDPYFMGLDDISVKPVPAAPRVQAVVRAPASINFTFAVTAGENYQVQYKTDLAQPEWTDLGSPIAADTNTLTFTDTDIANYPQKFYRLVPIP